MKTTFDPNILALLAPKLGGGRNMPRFVPGGDMDPNLGALLVGAGLLPRRQDTSGQYLLPGQEQGGPSGLDNQQFKGLDRLHAMQQGRSDRYSSPTFTTPEMGFGARVSQSPTVYQREQRPAGPYQAPARMSPINMQATPEEEASMAKIRQQVETQRNSFMGPQQPPQPKPTPYSQTPQFQAFEKAAPNYDKYFGPQADATYAGPSQLRQRAVHAAQQAQSIVRDFEQRRQAENDQHRQQAMAGLGQFAGDVGRSAMGQIGGLMDKERGYQAKARSEQARISGANAASRQRGWSPLDMFPDMPWLPQALRGVIPKKAPVMRKPTR